MYEPYVHPPRFRLFAAEEKKNEFILTRNEHAVAYVCDEIAPLGHGPRYDGGCGRGEHVLEEPEAALVTRHPRAGEVLFAVVSATAAAVRQPEAHQPVRQRAQDLKPKRAVIIIIACVSGLRIYVNKYVCVHRSVENIRVYD